MTYRNSEIKTIAGWIARGDSGTIVGLPGAGRATMMNYLAERPDALQEHLPDRLTVIMVPVDLNNLPDDSLATLYRIFLRSLYETRFRFPQLLQTAVSEQYRKHEAAQDPFLPQSGLRELLLLFQAQELRLVLLLNRFDNFCRQASLEMIKTLRGLRDGFKDTVVYLVGMSQPVVYLSDLPSIEPLYHLLDSHICWVGPLADDDARDMIQRHIGESETAVAAHEISRLLALTGGYPSLIRVCCHWWLETPTKPPPSDWSQILLVRTDMKHRLAGLWSGLNQEERSVLAELQKRRGGGQEGASGSEAEQQYRHIREQLVRKEICRLIGGHWTVVSDLFAKYIGTAASHGRGKVWRDPATNRLLQGHVPLTELKPQEAAVLQHLVENPHVRFTHSQLIEAAWPDDVHKEGVSTEALYQSIRGIRKKIEPDTRSPSYLINWRGQPEGGYQFFPEGRPQL